MCNTEDNHTHQTHHTRYLGGGRREESCGWASGGRHDVLPLSIE